MKIGAVPGRQADGAVTGGVLLRRRSGASRCGFGAAASRPARRRRRRDPRWRAAPHVVGDAAGERRAGGAQTQDIRDANEPAVLAVRTHPRVTARFAPRVPDAKARRARCVDGGTPEEHAHEGGTVWPRGDRRRGRCGGPRLRRPHNSTVKPAPHFAACPLRAGKSHRPCSLSAPGEPTSGIPSSRGSPRGERSAGKRGALRGPP